MSALTSLVAEKRCGGSHRVAGARRSLARRANRGWRASTGRREGLIEHAYTLSHSRALVRLRLGPERSISSRLAPAGAAVLRPRRASICAKRRSNFALAPRNAASGSTLRWRARLTTANSRSPTSPDGACVALARFRPRPRRSPRAAWRGPRAHRSSRTRPCPPSPAI